MQQLELSPARFSPQELNEQQQELQENISLLLDTVAVDEVTILFFLEESEREIDPETEFFSIIQKPRPSSKHAQLSTLDRLAYCFYSLSLQQREDFEIIQALFQKYLRRSSFPSSFVLIHEQVRNWGLELRFHKTLNGHKKKLEKIRELMDQNEKRLDLLKWRVQLCLVLFDIILIKQKTQRLTIAKILRQFKNLKKENKISTRPTLQAFSFLVNHLIATNNQAYILFEREIHIWSQQIVDNTLICQMKALVKKCQLHSINNLKSKTTINLQSNRITRGIAKPKMQTIIIGNDINSRLYQPSSQRAQKMLRKRPSRQQEENFMKQINHFLKTREGRTVRSAENTNRSQSKTNVKISIKLSDHRSSSSNRQHIQPYSPFTKPITASIYLQPKIKRDQSALIQTFSASKSGGSFYRKKGTRKRKQMYEKIVEKQMSKSLISSKHLRDEMFSLTEVEEQRCNITLQEILIGQLGKQVEQPLLKFVGAIEDIQFGVLHLTYLTVFNQQLAQLDFKIRKNSKNVYIVQAKVRSTYCPHTTFFRVGKNNKAQFTIQELNQSIVGSSIYYEALQQRIQRKISISQLQGMQELFYQYLHSQLSQNQLNKILLCVDLLESQFFWYYTKSNYLSGTRLEKRNTMDFYDLSAFAVSLGKFKADFDSCLHEIVVVENVKSLVETCVYLSHGRKIVYKALRKVKGQFFLQYLEATNSVYRSFSRKFRQPYFANTTLYRNMMPMSLFSRVFEKVESEDFICDSLKLKKSFNLSQVFKEQDIFIFLMKNIVQNFIQLKYLRQIQKKLLALNRKEDYEIFDQRLVECVLKFKQDIIHSDNEVTDETNFKPLIHSSLRFIRENIITYCEAYKIGLNLSIVKKQIHLLFLLGDFYHVQEILLANGIRIIKASKKVNRSTYVLFFCHQPLSELTLVPSPFHKRLALKHKNCLYGNLVRKNQPQPFLSLDLIPVCKQLIKLPHGEYCYVSPSQCLSLLGWRLDLYFPRTQSHFATYLDEQIFLQWLSGQNQQQVWPGLLKMMNISQSQRKIQLQDRRLQLFRCLRSLAYSKDQIEGSLELIQLDGQLQYLVCNYEANIISLGKVQSIMFLNSKSILSNTEKESLKSYQNILNFLYYKITNAKLPAETISLDYFIIQSDFCSFLLFLNNF